jgi:hypothetical protein
MSNRINFLIFGILVNGSGSANFNTGTPARETMSGGKAYAHNQSAGQEG